MSKKSKREEKIRNHQTNVSLNDFEWLINQYGQINEGGNHPLAIIGNRTFPYKRKNHVSTVYVRKVLEIIDHL